MPFYLIVNVVDGERRYFIQEASAPIFAFLRASIAGHAGKQLEWQEVGGHIPKHAVGRVMSQAEVDTLLKTEKSPRAPGRSRATRGEVGHVWNRRKN
jgi:hypothetical protein